MSLYISMAAWESSWKTEEEKREKEKQKEKEKEKEKEKQKEKEKEKENILGGKKGRGINGELAVCLVTLCKHVRNSWSATTANQEATHEVVPLEGLHGR